VLLLGSEIIPLFLVEMDSELDGSAGGLGDCDPVRMGDCDAIVGTILKIMN
jgi:hypothetical protein